MITPAFKLDWTAGAAQSGVDVVRAGVATFVGSDGYIQSATADTQRIDWSQTTPGLLVEESRTNYATYSDDFSAGWSVATNTAITTKNVTAPDGGSTCVKLYESTTASAARSISFTTSSIAPSSPSVLSIYAKADERTNLLIRIFDNAAATNYVWANFDLATGLVNGRSNVGNATGASARMVPAANGFYRCILSGIPNTSGSTTRVTIYIASGTGNSTNYTGILDYGFYIFGGQIEAGTFATSYIPTETTTITRNADVATITGSNFSDFWQATSGGASVLATPSTVSGICPLVQFDDNTANEIIALRGNTTNPELYVVDGGTPQAQLDAGSITANTAYSLTGWWATDDCKARKDSGAVVSDYTATIPTVTQARIGSDGTNYLNGTIATINYYDSFFGKPIYTRRKNKVFSSLL
jgi:hypothetical protein